MMIPIADQPTIAALIIYGLWESVKILLGKKLSGCPRTCFERQRDEEPSVMTTEEHHAFIEHDYRSKITSDMVEKIHERVIELGGRND